MEIKAVALFFWINWSAICVVQHRCAMIAMGEGYVDKYFLFSFYFLLISVL